MENKEQIFVNAIDDLFDARRGISGIWGFHEKVPARYLRPIMLEMSQQNSAGCFPPEPEEYVSSARAVNPIKAYIEWHPEFCNHSLVEKILGYMLKHSRRKYTENKRRYPWLRNWYEKRNTFGYTGMVWKTLGAIASVKPQLFEDEEIKSQLREYFTNPKYLRHKESAKTISALYFKHGALSPYDYAFLSLHALNCDCETHLPQIYSGMFIDDLTRAFSISDATVISGSYSLGLSVEQRRHNAIHDESTYDRSISYLFPEIEKRQDALVNEFPEQAVDFLRTLSKNKKIKVVSFQVDCKNLLIKILRQRPKLAKEDDLAFFDTGKSNLVHPQTLKSELETLQVLAQEYPDWTWNTVKAQCQRLEKGLENAKPYYQNISIGFSDTGVQMGVRRTECDDQSSLYLSGWDPADRQTVTALGILCSELASLIKTDHSRAPLPSAKFTKKYEL